MNVRPHLAALLTAAIFCCPARSEAQGAGRLAVDSKIPTLTLKNGRTFTGVTVTKIDDLGISIMHDGGPGRIKFDQFPAEFAKEIEALKKATEGPPARFPEDATTLFSAVSTQYWLNYEPGRAANFDSRPDLDRLAGTSDPLLKEAVKAAVALDDNKKARKEREALLTAKMNLMAIGLWDQILGGYDMNTLEGLACRLEQGIDGANTFADINALSELEVDWHKLRGTLRQKVTALAKRDQPKVEVLPNDVDVEFVMPGFLCITNRTGKTLHRCVFATTTAMIPPQDVVQGQVIAAGVPLLIGFSEQFAAQAALQVRLRANLAGAERSGVTYAPVLRDRESICIPFCDAGTIWGTAAVRLSLWTDEFTGEDALIPGLQGLKDELAMEEQARRQREQGEAGRGGQAPGNFNGRVNLRPKIRRDPNNPLHQGTGRRIFDRR